jgi:hypothetical protein
MEAIKLTNKIHIIAVFTLPRTDRNWLKRLL